MLSSVLMDDGWIDITRSDKKSIYNSQLLGYCCQSALVNDGWIRIMSMKTHCCTLSHAKNGQ
jgi:hypothetical protein